MTQRTITSSLEIPFCLSVNVWGEGHVVSVFTVFLLFNFQDKRNEPSKKYTNRFLVNETF